MNSAPEHRHLDFEIRAVAERKSQTDRADFDAQSRSSLSFSRRPPTAPHCSPTIGAPDSTLQAKRLVLDRHSAKTRAYISPELCVGACSSRHALSGNRTTPRLRG